MRLNKEFLFILFYFCSFLLDTNKWVNFSFRGKGMTLTRQELSFNTFCGGLWRDKKRNIYSSNRSLFSRESMSPPSDSTTRWPISWRSALIPSSSKEPFFLAIFGSRLKAESTQASREERPLFCPLPQEASALTIFAEGNCCYLWYPRNFSHSDRVLLSVIKINFSLLFFKEVLLFHSVLHKQQQINL